MSAANFTCSSCGHVNAPPDLRPTSLPATTGAAPQAKPLTPIQLVMAAYKVAKGIPKDSAGWDRANFSRYSRAAKSLLDRFGGVPEKAVAYLLMQGEELNDAGYDKWNLETIKAKAWDDANIFSEGDINAAQHGTLGADRILAARGPGHPTPARELAGDTLREIETRSAEAN